jgi:hypothetical protein
MAEDAHSGNESRKPADDNSITVRLMCASSRCADFAVSCFCRELLLPARLGEGRNQQTANTADKRRGVGVESQMCHATTRQQSPTA